MKKIAFVFPGQGVQYPGMMKDFYDSFSECSNIYAISDQILNFSVSKMSFYGTQEDLNGIINAQLCVLTANIAAYQAIYRSKLSPDMIAGLSLGEYAALVVAGVLSFEEALKIVYVRANAMKDTLKDVTGGMVAVIGKNTDIALEICTEIKKGFIAPANFNCPNQIVFAGDSLGIKEFIAKTKKVGIHTFRLAVNAPFHTKLLLPAAKKLEKEFLKYNLKNPQTPLYMNVDGERTKEPDKISMKCVNQTNSPVYWEKTIMNMINDGADIFIEIGPGKTLSGLIRKINKGSKIYNVFDINSLNKTLSALL